MKQLRGFYAQTFFTFRTSYLRRSVRVASCKSGQHDWHQQHRHLTLSSARYQTVQSVSSECAKRITCYVVTLLAM